MSIATETLETLVKALRKTSVTALSVAEEGGEQVLKHGDKVIIRGGQIVAKESVLEVRQMGHMMMVLKDGKVAASVTDDVLKQSDALVAIRDGSTTTFRKGEQTLATHTAPPAIPDQPIAPSTALKKELDKSVDEASKAAKGTGDVAEDAAKPTSGVFQRMADKHITLRSIYQDASRPLSERVIILSRNTEIGGDEYLKKLIQRTEYDAISKPVTRQELNMIKGSSDVSQSTKDAFEQIFKSTTDARNGLGLGPIDRFTYNIKQTLKHPGLFAWDKTTGAASWAGRVAMNNKLATGVVAATTVLLVPPLRRAVFGFNEETSKKDAARQAGDIVGQTVKESGKDIIDGSGKVVVATAGGVAAVVNTIDEDAAQTIKETAKSAVVAGKEHAKDAYDTGTGFAGGLWQGFTGTTHIPPAVAKTPQGKLLTMMANDENKRTEGPHEGPVKHAINVAKDKIDHAVHAHPTGKDAPIIAAAGIASAPGLLSKAHDMASAAKEKVNPFAAVTQGIENSLTNARILFMNSPPGLALKSLGELFVKFIDLIKGEFNNIMTWIKVKVGGLTAKHFPELGKAQVSAAPAPEPVPSASTDHAMNMGWSGDKVRGQALSGFASANIGGGYSADHTAAIAGARDALAHKDTLVQTSDAPRVLRTAFSDTDRKPQPNDFMADLFSPWGRKLAPATAQQALFPA